MGQITVDQKKCTKCGICHQVCPALIIEPANVAAFPYIPQEQVSRCIDCGHCEVFCPSEALSHEYTVASGAKAIYQNPDITAKQIEMYIKSRRSVRNFMDKPVEKEKIEKIMDIVRYAPTAVNMQQVKWVVVHDAKETKNLARLSIDWMKNLVENKSPIAKMLNAESAINAWDNGRDTIFRNAPHLAVAYAPNDNQFAEIDAMIALSYLDLTLPGFDLGGFWAGYFKFAADSWAPIRKELSFPDDQHVVHAIAFGYQKYRVSELPKRKPSNIIWK